MVCGGRGSLHRQRKRQPIYVSGVTVLRTDGSRIRDARIYYDLTPVFAVAQTARSEAQPRIVQEAIVHEREGHRGAFVIRRDGVKLADLSYTLGGTSRFSSTPTWTRHFVERGPGRASSRLLWLGHGPPSSHPSQPLRATLPTA
jgi:hypothetical protein